MANNDDVSANCIAEPDLRERIEECDGDLGCTFCGEADAPTMPLSELCAILVAGVEKAYSRAIDILPYDNESESGYGGTTYLTSEVLFDSMRVDLPRDVDGALEQAILAEIGDRDEPWCEYDPAVLATDESLLLDWEKFSEVVKHERRFFFHRRREAKEWIDDSLSPRQLLHAIAKLVEARVVKMPRYELFRARRHVGGPPLTAASDLGPPPRERATQSNRMNPPGIPMFYGAENCGLAIVEVGAEMNETVSVGVFCPCKTLRVLDLALLLRVPGFFSAAARDEIMALSFFQAFAKLITAPVRRTDQTILEYIPTQVFTEFLRDYKFSGGQVDGIRYRSSTRVHGANVVLFIGPDDVAGAGESVAKSKIRFVDAREAVRDVEALGTLYDTLKAVWGPPLFGWTLLPSCRVLCYRMTPMRALSRSKSRKLMARTWVLPMRLTLND